MLGCKRIQIIQNRIKKQCACIYIYIILTSKDIEHIGLDLENLGTEILGVYIYITVCV